MNKFVELMASRKNKNAKSKKGNAKKPANDKGKMSIKPPRQIGAKKKALK